MHLPLSGGTEKSKVVRVDVDDKSRSQLGPWPWPPRMIAEMLEILTEAGVQVVGLDLSVLRPANREAIDNLKAIKQKLTAAKARDKTGRVPGWLVEDLEQLRRDLNTDSALIRAVERCENVILAFEAQEDQKSKAVDGTGEPFLQGGFLKVAKKGEWLQSTRTADRLFLPFPALSEAASGLGHLIMKAKDVSGPDAHVPYISYQGNLIPSYPLRLAMASAGLTPGRVLVQERGIRMGTKHVPLFEGHLLLSRSPHQTPHLRYSYVDLLDAGKAPAALKGKIALIGFSPSNTARTAGSPMGGLSRGEFVATVVDNLLDDRFIRRSPLMFFVEFVALLAVLGVATLLFTKMRELNKAAVWIALTGTVLLFGVISLSVLGLWFKTAYILTGLLVLYIAVSFKELLFFEQASLEAIETNRLLGLNYQKQGLFDEALERFQLCPPDEETRSLIYTLGRQYEKEGMVGKALAVYEYVQQRGGFKDLDERISKLRTSDNGTIDTMATETGVGIISSSPVGIKKKIGPYRILEEVGQGTMGLVYKAQAPNLDSPVAVKVIRFSQEFDVDTLNDIKTRFFREAEIAGQLSHPSIIKIHDVGEVKDVTYMAMEFLEGENLARFCTKENRLPLADVLRIVASVAEALDYAHHANVIHRDIKPANIMLLDNGGIKVTDFGIAKAMSTSETKTGVILGTPNYMSPEQIMGHEVGSRTDIFSLGVLFFHLLTGELPFQGKNLSSLLFNITQARHPSLRVVSPGLPRACEQILDKAMAKDPKKRFATAGEMAKYLNIMISRLDESSKRSVAGAENF
jgi:serine/threonine-protein kinase